MLETLLGESEGQFSSTSESQGNLFRRQPFHRTPANGLNPWVAQLQNGFRYLNLRLGGLLL
jgi:hypothetical protein